MRAFILVGGFGTRLKTLGLTQPKPMIKIGGRPFLEYLIQSLKCAGIKEIILCVGYGAEYIKNYFGNGQQWDLSIFYSEEKTPLGTGGAIKLAQKFAVTENLILNGDSYLTLDYQQMLQFHRQKQALITIACTPTKETGDFGNIQLDPSQRIVAFAEKIKANQAGLINGGIYLFQKEAFDFIPPAQKVSIERETFPQAVRSGRCFAFITKGYFIDIGTPERLARAKVELTQHVNHL